MGVGVVSISWGSPNGGSEIPRSGKGVTYWRANWWAGAGILLEGMMGLLRSARPVLMCTCYRIHADSYDGVDVLLVLYRWIIHTHQNALARVWAVH